MDRLRKSVELERCFIGSRERTPGYLMKAMECGRHTLYRTIRMVQLQFDMPLVYDPIKKVWRLEEKRKNVALPYIWFNPREVLVLLALLENFRDFPFGMLDDGTEPFKEKLGKVLQSEHEEMGELLRKVKIIPIGNRKVSRESLAAVCQALALSRMIEINYRDRQKEESSVRIVSPLQLVRYRDNWYMDGYCHKRDSLRTFSLDRMASVKLLDEPAKKVARKEAEEYFAESFGIFGGKAKEKAVLKFSPEMARWVSSEEWHPKQKANFEKDGSYILELPYSDERELVLDIMKYGDGVEVLSPQSLRKTVRKKLQRALEKYRK